MTCPYTHKNRCSQCAPERRPIPAGSEYGASDDALGFAIMEHLGPEALAGGQMSLLQAFEKGWHAALSLAGKGTRK